MMEVICGGRTINSWASWRAQGGQFHRHARVALTADGAVIQNTNFKYKYKYKNPHTSTNRNRAQGG